VIVLDHVSKRFNGRSALEQVSFEIGKNQLCGFVGPNGAGKTTALRIISGYLSPDAGAVRVDGVDAVRDPRAASARVGYLPETAPSYPEMRVRDYLRFRAQVKGIAGGRAHAAIDQSLDKAGLDSVAKEIIGRLSRGFRQRIGIADALLGEPRVLLLDEPTAGLDPVQVREFREVLCAIAKSHTVLFSSHILPEVETLCDRLIILVGGKVVADGTLDNLREQHDLPAAASLEQVFVRLCPSGRAEVD
jgi:ABC-2 type transport system ATP-binding protein